MIVYNVLWRANEELAKGNGRIAHKDFDFFVSVLCRNMKDAIQCFEYVFSKDYQGKLSICDGETTVTRKKIDSRNIEFQYIFMDGIKQPLKATDLKKALFDYAPTSGLVRL